MTAVVLKYENQVEFNIQTIHSICDPAENLFIPSTTRLRDSNHKVSEIILLDLLDIALAAVNFFHMKCRAYEDKRNRDIVLIIHHE